MTALKWIIGVIILVVALGLAYVFWKEQSFPSYTAASKEAPGRGVVGNAAIDQDPFDIAITATDDGFDPSEITIKKGMRVRFINQSKMDVWPASGVHPTHSLYPEKESTDCLGSSFDACTPLKKGEFYDFTFNYVGEWRYHDHEHAYNTGVITVTE